MVHSLEGSTAVRLQSLRRIPYSIAHYALLYDGEKLYNPTKRNFRKLFPDKKEAMEQYITENKLNLNQARDALLLYNFLSH